MSLLTTFALHFLQLIKLALSGMSLIHKQNLSFCTLVKKAQSVREKGTWIQSEARLWQDALDNAGERRLGVMWVAGLLCCYLAVSLREATQPASQSRCERGLEVKHDGKHGKRNRGRTLGPITSPGERP